MDQDERTRPRDSIGCVILSGKKLNLIDKRSSRFRLKYYASSIV